MRGRVSGPWHGPARAGHHTRYAVEPRGCRALLGCLGAQKTATFDAPSAHSQGTGLSLGQVVSGMRPLLMRTLAQGASRAIRPGCLGTCPPASWDRGDVVCRGYEDPLRLNYTYMFFEPLLQGKRRSRFSAARGPAARA